MKRVDALNHVSNQYSDGTPGQNDATVVGAGELNNIQEEICRVIELAGLTVDQDQNDIGGNPDYEQLFKAILSLLKEGGSQTVYTINNNETASQNLTGLIFNKTTIQSAIVPYSLFRKTDTSQIEEVGQIRVSYNDVLDSWSLETSSSFGDGGVEFAISSAGQISYEQSTNMSGGNYDGKLRVAGIITIKI